MINLVIEAFEEDLKQDEYLEKDDKLEWVCQNIFDFHAYETSEISNELHREIMLFIHGVATGKGGIYKTHLKLHLLWANYFDKLRWLTWGVSLRHCWFESGIYIQMIDKTFSENEFKRFIIDLAKWCEGKL